MTEAEPKTRRGFLVAAATTAGALAMGDGHRAEAHEAISINAMGPTPEQMQAFLALPEEPIVMVNLLKFKPDGGAEAYGRYAQAVGPFLQKVGAKSLFAGRAATCLIGNGDWDMIALVEYPKPQALLDMATSEEYQAIHHHREEGLVGQVNYAVVQRGF